MTRDNISLYSSCNLSASLKFNQKVTKIFKNAITNDFFVAFIIVPFMKD